MQPLSNPMALKYFPWTSPGAKVTAVIDSPLMSKCSPMALYLSIKVSNVLLLFSPQTIVLPSREPVQKYLESCVHAQHQIILVWIPVFLSVVAANWNLISFSLLVNKDHLLSLDTDSKWRESGENASCTTVKVWEVNFWICVQVDVSLQLKNIFTYQI